MRSSMWRLCMAVLLAGAALKACEAAPRPFSAKAYPQQVQLDPKYTLYWRIEAEQKRIALAAKVETSGFVGLGISEMGQMLGSDMIVGWIDGEGRAVVTDRFAFNRSDASGLPLDGQQDVSIVAGTRLSGPDGRTFTILEFTRPLDSGDCNDRPITAGQTHVIWSYGLTTELGYHGSASRGSRTIFFFQEGGVLEQAPSRGEGQIWDVTATDYNLPSNYTTYACKSIKMPFLRKTHIIQWEPLINGTAPEAVHHMVLMACRDYENPPSEGVFSCMTLEQCPQARLLASWAVGGTFYKFPPEAGLPVGPGGYNKLVLQTHYTNPEGRTDIVDSSGLRFTVTEKLRANDAGGWMLGPVLWHQTIAIPPGQKTWTQSSTCTSECTGGQIAELPGGEINIIGSMLHMHTAGTAMWAKHYRNGRELAEVNRVDYYNFNFQQFEMLDEPIVFKAGDSLETTCVFDTTGRTNVTLGGESTKDEMCFHPILYYPAHPTGLDICFQMCIPNSAFAGGNSTAPAPTLPSTNGGAGTVTNLCNTSGLLPIVGSPCDPLTYNKGLLLPHTPLAGCSNQSRQGALPLLTVEAAIVNNASGNFWFSSDASAVLWRLPTHCLAFCALCALFLL